MFNSYLKLETDFTPINYFPENNKYIIDMELFTDSYACLNINDIEKQKKKVLSQKFWKIFVTNNYNINNISELENEFNSLNLLHKITSSNILIAICFQNNKYEVIWANEELKTLYESGILYIINLLDI
jgi:hypothetical protein